MALLVDGPVMGHVGMGHDHLEPPCGPRLLHADADEVGRAGLLTGHGRGRRVRKTGLPRGEGPDAASHALAHRAGQRLAQSVGRPVQRLSQRCPEGHGVRLPQDVGIRQPSGVAYGGS